MELNCNYAHCHFNLLLVSLLKFFLSNGEYFKEKLQFLPFASEFTSSKILVVCTDDADKIAGVCGIRSLLNIPVMYICKEYRGQGLGLRLLKTAVEIAQRNPPNFVVATISSRNAAILHIVLKLGFRKALYLNKSHQILIVSCSTRMGKLACVLFRAIGRLLPNRFLSYVHLWLYARTV